LENDRKISLFKTKNMAQKPLILAVETSSRVGSVAIAVGQNLLAETTFSGPMRHGAEIFPAIERLLDRFARKSQEIEHVYISVGPGSFTGLRIATTLAKTMCLANPPGRTKIVAVDTLDVIAANLDLSILDTGYSSVIEHRASSIENRVSRIGVILDAKRNQFFIAVYQRTTDKKRDWKKILPDSLMTASQFIEKFPRPALGGAIWLLGDGLLYYKDKFKAKGVCFLEQKYWSPRASKVYELGWQKALAGQFADPVTITPNYLLRPDAEEKLKQHKNS